MYKTKLSHILPTLFLSLGYNVLYAQPFMTKKPILISHELTTYRQDMGFETNRRVYYLPSFEMVIRSRKATDTGFTYSLEIFPKWFDVAAEWYHYKRRGRKTAALRGPVHGLYLTYYKDIGEREEEKILLYNPRKQQDLRSPHYVSLEMTTEAGKSLEDAAFGKLSQDVNVPITIEVHFEGPKTKGESSVNCTARDLVTEVKGRLPQPFPRSSLSKEVKTSHQHCTANLDEFTESDILHEFLRHNLIESAEGQGDEEEDSGPLFSWSSQELGETFIINLVRRNLEQLTEPAYVRIAKRTYLLCIGSHCEFEKKEKKVVPDKDGRKYLEDRLTNAQRDFDYGALTLKGNRIKRQDDKLARSIQNGRVLVFWVLKEALETKRMDVMPFKKYSYLIVDRRPREEGSFEVEVARGDLFDFGVLALGWPASLSNVCNSLSHREAEHNCEEEIFKSLDLQYSFQNQDRSAQEEGWIEGNSRIWARESGLLQIRHWPDRTLGRLEDFAETIREGNYEITKKNKDAFLKKLDWFRHQSAFTPTSFVGVLVVRRHDYAGDIGEGIIIPSSSGLED